RLKAARIRPVTSETLIGKNWLDVPRKVDRFRTKRWRAAYDQHQNDATCPDSAPARIYTISGGNHDQPPPRMNSARPPIGLASNEALRWPTSFKRHAILSL